MKNRLMSLVAVAVLAACSSPEESRGTDAQQAAAAAGALEPAADTSSSSDAYAAAMAAAAAADVASAESGDDAAFDSEPDDAYAEGTDHPEPVAAGERQQPARGRDQRAGARDDVLSAQDDLNRSVRRLSNNDWREDLPTVQRRLRSLGDANDRLNAVDPGAGSNLDFEISRMKRETRRLEDENWRDVVPDLERRNRAIGDEAQNLENLDDAE